MSFLDPSGRVRALLHTNPDGDPGFELAGAGGRAGLARERRARRERPALAQGRKWRGGRAARRCAGVRTPPRPRRQRRRAARASWGCDRGSPFLDLADDEGVVRAALGRSSCRTRRATSRSAGLRALSSCSISTARLSGKRRSNNDALAVVVGIPREGFFREEALQHHTGARVSGDLLRVPPSWTRWTFAFLLAVFVAGAAYATLGSVTGLHARPRHDPRDRFRGGVRHRLLSGAGSLPPDGRARDPDREPIRPAARAPCTARLGGVGAGAVDRGAREAGDRGLAERAAAVSARGCRRVARERSLGGHQRRRGSPCCGSHRRGEPARVAAPGLSERA